jgi:hypothetical protein
MSMFEEVDGRVVVSFEQKTIPEFRRIIERDKDRNKRVATQEFSYIYFMCDYRSPYVKNTPEAERGAKLKKELQLPPNWKEDADMVYAMQRYKLNQITASIDSLETTRESLLTANAVIKLLRKQIEEMLKDPDIATNPVNMQLCVDNLERVLKLSVSVPKMIDTITVLEEKVKKEQSMNKIKLKGGGDKGNYEE